MQAAAMRSEDFDAAKRHKQLLDAVGAATAELVTLEAQKQAGRARDTSDATRNDLDNAKREAERVRTEARTRISALEAKLRSRETDLVNLRR